MVLAALMLVPGAGDVVDGVAKFMSPVPPAAVSLSLTHSARLL